MSSLTPARRALLLLLSVAQLMVILDVSAVNVALPSLSRDLGIGRGSLEWAITSYSLLFGSLLLLGGRAADLVGRRRVFVAGLALFTGASLLAGLAPDAGLLYGARAAQGVGAATLSPAALSIVTVLFNSGRERTLALGVWGAVSAAGGAVGVLLGGLLTTLIGWRAIFFINVPIGVLLAAALIRSLPADERSPRWAGLDLPGALLATASLAALLYGMAGASSAGWTSLRTLGPAAAGLAGLLAFGRLERRTAQPLLRLERLAQRAAGGGVALMLLASAVLIGSFLLTSLYLQEVLGASPLATGAEFLPIAVATGAGAHAAGHLVRHAGVRVPIALAFALAGAGAVLLTGVNASGSYLGSVLPGMALTGFGLGIAVVSIAVAILTGADEGDAGMLSGANNTGHEVGGALGLAVLTSIAARTTAGAAPAAGAAIALGIGHAFVAAAAIAGAGALLALVVLPRAGSFLPRLRGSAEPVRVH